VALYLPAGQLSHTRLTPAAASYLPASQLSHAVLTPASALHLPAWQLSHARLMPADALYQGQAQNPTASATRRKIHNLFCLPPLLLATVLPDPAIPITRTPPTTLPATVWCPHTLKSDDVVRSRQNGRHWEKGNSPTSRARPLCVRLSSIVGLMVHEDELKAARAYRRGDRAMYRSGIWSQ